MLIANVGCAGLLGIPADPQLGEESDDIEVGAAPSPPDPAAGESEPTPPSSTEEIPEAGSSEGSPMGVALDPSSAAQQETSSQSPDESQESESRPAEPSEMEMVDREPEAEMPADPDIEAPDEPDIEVPEEPDIEVPDEPDIEVPEEPDIEVPDEPDIEVPDEPDIEVPEEPAAPVAGCGSNAVLGPAGGCWRVLQVPRSWGASRRRCRSIGAGWDLASIRSEEENEFVDALGSDQLWIGGSDLASEGDWVWVDDGTPFWEGRQNGRAVGRAFVAWSGNEPNGGANSDCARTVPGRAEWADLACALERQALCLGPES